MAQFRVLCAPVLYSRVNDRVCLREKDDAHARAPVQRLQFARWIAHTCLFFVFVVVVIVIISISICEKSSEATRLCTERHLVDLFAENQHEFISVRRIFCCKKMRSPISMEILDASARPSVFLLKTLSTRSFDIGSFPFLAIRRTISCHSLVHS